MDRQANHRSSNHNFLEKEIQSVIVRKTSQLQIIKMSLEADKQVDYPVGGTACRAPTLKRLGYGLI